MQFIKANRTQRKLRLALLGPTGSGKTFSALKIARGIAGPKGRIALVDTENASASLYSDTVEFDSLQLSSFAPDQYVKAIRAAEEAGYDVLVIDSLSHAWAGKDGSLEMVDRRAAQSNSGSSFEAWRHVTPQHNQMVEALIRCRMHLIITMRVKTEYVVEKDERTGKSKPRKVGLSPVMRDGVEYEFDIVGDMDKAVLSVSKTRYSALNDQVITKPDESLGKELVKWLNTGEAPKLPEPAAPAERQQANKPPSDEIMLVRLKGNGGGEADVVEVCKLKESKEGARDPWTLWQVTLQRDNYRTELTTLSKSVYEAALLAKTHGKPAECSWRITPEGYQELVTCKPIGVPTPPPETRQERPATDRPHPDAGPHEEPATAGSTQPSASKPRSGRGRSIASLTKDNPPAVAG